MLKLPEFYGSDIDNKVQIVCKARVLCKSVIRLSTLSCVTLKPGLRFLLFSQKESLASTIPLSLLMVRAD